MMTDDLFLILAAELDLLPKMPRHERRFALWLAEIQHTPVFETDAQ